MGKLGDELVRQFSKWLGWFFVYSLIIWFFIPRLNSGFLNSLVTNFCSTSDCTFYTFWFFWWFLLMMFTFVGFIIWPLGRKR